VESVPALAVALCLIFACNDLAIGPAWASCADVGERYAGTLGGAMNMIGNLFGAVGGVITGYLLDAKRADLLFMIFAGSFWLAALCWLSLDVTRTLAGSERKA
jgi:ACS family glucarate transporter-like MFS transporter